MPTYLVNSSGKEHEIKADKWGRHETALWFTRKPDGIIAYFTDFDWFKELPDTPPAEDISAQPNLEPCAMCGGAAKHAHNKSFVYCRSVDCGVFGPDGDTDGAKWNRMQVAIREHKQLREIMEGFADPNGSMGKVLHMQYANVSWKHIAQRTLAYLATLRPPKASQ